MSRQSVYRLCRESARIINVAEIAARAGVNPRDVNKLAREWVHARCACKSCDGSGEEKNGSCCVCEGEGRDVQRDGRMILDGGEGEFECAYCHEEAFEHEDSCHGCGVAFGVPFEPSLVDALLRSTEAA